MSFKEVTKKNIYFKVEWNSDKWMAG